MSMLKRMRLTFVGTGVSCGIPVIGHLTTDCACRDAIANPSGPNRRNNVSLLISLPFREGESGVVWHHVLIDCGKTFRDAYMRVLAPMGVKSVDALLITHGHADAMHCVEELCGMQAEAATRYVQSASPSSSSSSVARTITPIAVPRTLRRVPTFVTAPTLHQIAMVSPELVKRSLLIGSAPATKVAYHGVLAATADTAATSSFSAAAPSTVMDVFYMDDKKPQRMHVPLGPLSPAATAGGTDAASDLPFYSFPVEHGKGYVSMAWVFGRGTAFKSQQTQQQQQPEGSCVVYISDVSHIPATSMAFLEDLVKIDVLVVDLLAEHGAPSASHYCADEAIPLVVKLTPRRTYFVGMFCSLEHHRTNALLAQELTELKMRYRSELDAVVTGSSLPAAMDAAEREKKRAFESQVVSMELAYDGQVLSMDA